MSTNEEKSNGDVEAPLLYPSMEENPALRWAFIRKVYSILAVQLLVTVAVAAAVAANPPVALFFATTWGGWIVYLLFIIFVMIVTMLLAFYRQKHPLNFLLLAIFTLCFGLVIGLSVSFVSAIIILEASIATVVVVVTLTMYTFWASRRGEDFGYIKPFLLTLVVSVILFIIYQIFFPMGKISWMLYNGLFVLIFSLYIIIDTNVMIKRNTYDDYIWASVTLYLDILNLFLRLLRAFAAASRTNRT